MPHAHVNARAKEGGGGGSTLGALSLSMVRARIPFSQKKKG
jgi:hypothetical protein